MKREALLSRAKNCEERLANIHEHLSTFGHQLAEHATIIYSRSEIALEGADGECLPLRVHLLEIHNSAREIGLLSVKIRELISV